jgi:hypothetical protein
MRKLTLAAMLLSLAVPALGRAADSNDPMTHWVPRTPKKASADTKEITALLKSMEQAGKKGDLDAAVALVHFPVLMVTDDSQGQAAGESWNEDKWRQAMAPFYKQPMTMKVTHKPSVFLITDSLAVVNDTSTMAMPGKKVTTKSSMLLVRDGGTWKVKSMTEGGWGDMMKTQPASASAAEGTSGTGSSAGTGSASGTGSSGTSGAGSDTGTMQPGTGSSGSSTSGGATGTGSTSGTGSSSDTGTTSGTGSSGASGTGTTSGTGSSGTSGAGTDTGTTSGTGSSGGASGTGGTSGTGSSGTTPGGTEKNP